MRIAFIIHTHTYIYTAYVIENAHTHTHLYWHSCHMHAVSARISHPKITSELPKFVLRVAGHSGQSLVIQSKWHTPRKWTNVPWKGTILKGISSSNHQFSGDMLVSRRCNSEKSTINIINTHKKIRAVTPHNIFKQFNAHFSRETFCFH